MENTVTPPTRKQNIQDTQIENAATKSTQKRKILDNKMENSVTQSYWKQNIHGNKMGTVTRARQEREKQGPWEVEVSYGGEADLHQLYNDCVKNPGHKTFVPVDQFNVDHLPPGCRDNDLVDLVRAMSDVIVRVSAKYVSDKRPETVPGSDEPYPTYKDSDRNMLRTGTGWVWKVIKFPNRIDSFRTCKCQECKDSSSPKTQFAEIYIKTASHVIYDEIEAAHTTCHLFFDKGNTPKSRDCSGGRALSGCGFVERGEEREDWCSLVHMTHDFDLADRLDNMVDRQVNLMKKVNNKFRRLMPQRRMSSSPSEYLREVWDKLTIIVSHPHGCSKQISVGDWTGETVGARPIWTRYTTPTCPGSSGAPVFVMWAAGVRFWTIRQVHCGNCRDNKNLNFSNFI